MNLPKLGWNSFFETAFAKLANDGFLPARVIREDKIHYHIITESGLTTAELAGRLRQNTMHNKIPVVGDWVLISQKETDTLIIEDILPRRTELVRKIATGRKRRSGGKAESQVLAANIDIIFIVAGLDNEFNLRRIERYLTQVYASGAKPVVILNKSDLVADASPQIAQTESISFNVPVHAVSAKMETGLGQLQPYTRPGQTIALIGSSGVGKSTIINRLLGEQRQQISEKSSSVGKGMHTTTHRELILLPQGGLLMDNPGIREIQLWASEKDLSLAFSDITILAADCRFRDCRHVNEPGCAVRQAIEHSRLPKARYKSFLRQRDELSTLEEKRRRGTKG